MARLRRPTPPAKSLVDGLDRVLSTHRFSAPAPLFDVDLGFET
jgi:hypothetical protein